MKCKWSLMFCFRLKLSNYSIGGERGKRSSDCKFHFAQKCNGLCQPDMCWELSDGIVFETWDPSEIVSCRHCCLSHLSFPLFSLFLLFFFQRLSSPIFSLLSPPLSPFHLLSSDSPVVLAALCLSVSYQTFPESILTGALSPADVCHPQGQWCQTSL